MKTKRKGRTFTPDIRQILVPVDFSTSSQAALDYALKMAGKQDAQITLLHVIEPLHPDMLIDVTKAHKSMKAAGHRQLTALWEGSTKIWPRIGHELRQGHPATTIPALAKRIHADLIVMGTHGRTGLKRAMIGSVAERVVRNAPCPVLVVR